MALKLVIVTVFLVQAISGHSISLSDGNARGRFTVRSGLSEAGSGVTGGVLGRGLTGIAGGLNRGAFGSGMTGGAIGGGLALVSGGSAGIASGVTGGPAGSNMGNNLLNNYGNGVNDFILGNGEDISFGGTFGVSSLSSYSPSGLLVVSDNVLEGPVRVSGQLPFLGTVALGGSVPSGGFAGVSYGSGYSDVGILEQVGAGVCPCA